MTSQAKCKTFFDQNTKLNIPIERFSASEQEKYYNHIIIFNN